MTDDINKNDYIHLMGDLNARIGSQRLDNIIWNKWGAIY
jgi:hypothetical protein